MSTNCDVIVIFPIYGQFGEIRKPDYGYIVFVPTYSSKNNPLKSLTILGLTIIVIIEKIS